MTDEEAEREALVKDLVAAKTAPPATAFALDTQVQLLAEDRECAKNLAWWKKRREAIQEQLKELMGENTSGTVDNHEVLTYEYQDRFNSTAFRDEYPNLYKTYSREVTREEFDPEWLRKQRPDLYRKFQVRSLLNKYKAPGEK